MNTTNLQYLFQNYVKNFENFNRPGKESNETYKWAIIQNFQTYFDLDAADFADMLNSVYLNTKGLIDSAWEYPLQALVECAAEEPETVRALFADLYADDGGNLHVRQQKVNAFIDGTEKLAEKYHPGNPRYASNIRTTLALLAFHDPDHNYLFKATEAREIADCIGFYDDWGSGEDFELAVYYRMCDAIVAEMRSDEALMKVHQSRYTAAEQPLYEDAELHILCFDVIYSSLKYALLDGISYTRPDSKERKTKRELRQKAQELLQASEAAFAEVKQLNEIDDQLHLMIAKGCNVQHTPMLASASLGSGTVKALIGDFMTICFDRDNTEKKFELFFNLTNGNFAFENKAVMEYIDNNIEIIKRYKLIRATAERAAKALEPYREYL